jgi:hypothetical protein
MMDLFPDARKVVFPTLIFNRDVWFNLEFADPVSAREIAQANTLGQDKQLDRTQTTDSKGKFLILNWRRGSESNRRIRVLQTFQQRT